MAAVILVPTDGSKIAERALVCACAVAKRFRAELHVCYALDYLTLPGTLEKSAATAPDFLVEDGESVLARARAIARKHGKEAQGHLIRGSGAKAILRLAARLGAELVVMGTHGRKGLSRFFLGSVAEEVARAGKIPVLLIAAGAKIPATTTRAGGESRKARRSREPQEPR